MPPLEPLQPIILDTFVTLAPEFVDRVSSFVATKDPPKVIKQTPAPGTPVLQGMTIEIHAVSLSDVPFGVLDPKAPGVLSSIPITIMDKVLSKGDPTLKATFETGIVVDATGFTIAFNKALKDSGSDRTISEAEVTTVAQALKGREPLGGNTGDVSTL
jgi:hypothetical protein